MTREEAIKILKNTEDNINYDKRRDEIYFTHEWVGAYEMAIAALREQEETKRRLQEIMGMPESDEAFTNADHIRSMTDEELADFLVDLADDGNLLIREWLKEPYKEA